MILRAACFTIAIMTNSAVQAAAELVMVEEDGCVWCEEWNEELSPIYPKTAEGKVAPLRRIDIHSTRPDDLTFSGRLNYTPTFVLMVDGAEVSRIEGYPGEDFFWGLLGRMLQDAGIETSE